jgi:hypothetical protein
MDTPGSTCPLVEAGLESMTLVLDRFGVPKREEESMLEWRLKLGWRIEASDVKPQEGERLDYANGSTRM